MGKRNRGSGESVVVRFGLVVVVRFGLEVVGFGLVVAVELTVVVVVMMGEGVEVVVMGVVVAELGRHSRVCNFSKNSSLCRLL